MKKKYDKIRAIRLSDEVYNKLVALRKQRYESWNKVLLHLLSK